MEHTKVEFHRIMPTVDTKIQIPEAFSFLFEKAPYKVAYGGRGGAKSWNFGRAAILDVVENHSRFLCAREVQNSIEESVYTLLKQQIHEMGLSEAFIIQANKIKARTGPGEFLFKGLRQGHINSIKSFEGIDKCWVEEGQSVSEQSWDILDPTIRKEGSEIWVSFNTGTEEDPVYQRFIVNPPPGAIVRKINYDLNPFLPETLRAKMEHCRDTDEEKYNHIWLGIPSTIKGAYFAKLILKSEEEGRICTIPFEPTVSVDTFWDLGMDDSTTVWFLQVVGKELRMIDYFEWNNEGLDFYARYLKEKPYVYGKHYMPHDVEVRELGTGKRRKDVAESLGMRPVITVPRVPNQAEGIQAVRNILPRVWFDKDKCNPGLRALKAYHPEYNEKLDKYNDYPAHDWSSHGTKAFETFARGYEEKVEVTPVPTVRVGTNSWMA